MNNTDVKSVSDVVPYDSIQELKSVYSSLLKRLRDNRAEVSGFMPEIKDFIRRGQATGTLLDDDKERWEAQRSIDYWATLIYSYGNEPPESILAPFSENDAKVLALHNDLCPYRGLDAFGEAEQKDFFGRKNLINHLVARLESERFLAILGPSGSGKSSLVMAGLIPQLKSKMVLSGHQWHSFPKPLMPGSDPLMNMARHLRPSLSSPALSDQSQVEMFLNDHDHLLRTLDGLEQRPVILVVDQFEEVFTLCEDDAARKAFIANLLHVIEAQGSGHRVILTMRIDYEPFVARLPEFYAHFTRAQERVPPLEASELREAIELPAKRVGLLFEDGVINNLLQDILGEPAALPLLQFTLLKLWEHRRYNRVTQEAYYRLGGGRLALARSADELYDSMPPENQKTLQRILLRLVRPGVGLEVIRNRVRRVALLQWADAPERVEYVLDKLVKARLVRLTVGETPTDDQVEVAHEALIRNWPRLVEWLDDERVAIEARRSFEAKAAEWVRLGRGTSGLLNDEQLDEAARWLRSTDAARLGYDEALPALVEASRAAIRYARQQEEEADEREREHLRQLAEEQRERADQKAKAARYFRFLTVSLALLLFIVVAGTYQVTTQSQVVELQRDEAEQKRQLAENLRIKAEAYRIDADQQRTEAEKQTQIAKEKAADIEKAWKVAEAEKKRAEDETRKTKDAYRRLQVAAAREVLLRKEREDADLRAQLAKQEADEAQSYSLRVRERKEATDEIAVSLRQAGQVRPGASIGSEGVTGSVCCIVQDAAGVKYLLSFPYVFDGKSGSPILQPGGIDGGGKGAKVALIDRQGNDKYKSGALAKILPGINYSLEVAGAGTLKGVATSVSPGDVVRMLGRGSGLSEGKVISINTDGEILTTLDPCCGDAGGPVFTPDGLLVGMLWGSGSENSIVIPITRILQELNVELAR